MTPTHRSHDTTDNLREIAHHVAEGPHQPSCPKASIQTSEYRCTCVKGRARAALAAAPQPAPEDGLTRAQVGAMLDAKRHDREALVEVIREAWQSHEAALRAVLAERDALQGQLNDLRNGWANSVKAHADALAERDALDAIASKLQHDHDMMALANGKLEAERDAAFAAGQEEMRERVIGETTATRAEDATRDRIRALPIKPRS